MRTNGHHVLWACTVSSCGMSFTETAVTEVSYRRHQIWHSHSRRHINRTPDQPVMLPQCRSSMLSTKSCCYRCCMTRPESDAKPLDMANQMSRQTHYLLHSIRLLNLPYFVSWVLYVTIQDKSVLGEVCQHVLNSGFFAHVELNWAGC